MSTFDEVKKVLDAVDESLANKSAELEAKASELRTALDEIERSKANLTSVTAERDGLKKSNDTLRSEKAALTAELARVREELEACKNSHTPGPQPTKKTLYGFWAGLGDNRSSEGTRGNYNRVEGYMGKPEVYRMFYPGLLPATFPGSNADFGPPVVVSFKARPTDITAGKHDALIRGYFASIPTDRKVWWSYYHEPEDNIASGEFTAAQYRAAWVHLLKLIPKRDNLRSVQILMGYSIRPAAKRNIADYVQGLPEAGLDVLGWDSYLSAGTETPDACVDPLAAESKKWGVGFAIAEVSVSTFVAPGKTREDMFRELVVRLKKDPAGAEFVTWFESFKGDGDWRMRYFPSAVAEWRK